MKAGRHKITFLDPADLEAVTLAQLGQSNRVIKEASALTDSQIQYRLTKAKRLDRLPRGEGYRTQWRNGKSEIVRSILAAVAPGLRKENKQRLPRQLVRVAAEISPK